MIPGIETGSAILLIGLLSLLLWASVQFRNPMAVGMWGFTVLLLAISSVYSFPLEIVWMGIIAMTIVVIIGVAVRAT